MRSSNTHSIKIYEELHRIGHFLSEIRRIGHFLVIHRIGHFFSPAIRGIQDGEWTKRAQPFCATKRFGDGSSNTSGCSSCCTSIWKASRCSARCSFDHQVRLSLFNSKRGAVWGNLTLIGDRLTVIYGTLFMRDQGGTLLFYNTLEVSDYKKDGWHWQKRKDKRERERRWFLSGPATCLVTVMSCWRPTWCVKIAGSWGPSKSGDQPRGHHFGKLYAFCRDFRKLVFFLQYELEGFYGRLLWDTVLLFLMSCL